MTDHDFPPVFIYRGTWSCGCQYVGQTNNPTNRWSLHKTRPSSWAVKEHFDQYGTPDWEIIGRPEGYECGPPANRAEDIFLRWHHKHGTVVNRFGVDYENRSGKGPLAGQSLTRPGRTRRKYERTNKRSRCHLCGRRMPSDQFRSDRNRSSGLSNKCKDCENLIEKIRRNWKPNDRGWYATAKRIITDWQKQNYQTVHPRLEWNKIKGNL